MSAPTATRPTAGPSSSIDPRIRARRAEVLRSEARRRLYVALVVLAVVIVTAGGWFGLHSRLFAARVVTVVGAVHTPVDQIVAAAGLADHPPLIDVGAASAAGVDRLPWVTWATVSREWPDGVRITVRERAAVAVDEAVPSSAGWALVDRTGRVLAVTSRPPSGLPRVAGVVGPSSQVAPGSTARGVRTALHVVTSLPAAFAAEVSNVAQDKQGDVTLQLNSALTVYLGSTAHLRAKYEDVAAILKGAALASGSTIDVAAPATPVVKP